MREPRRRGARRRARSPGSRRPARSRAYPSSASGCRATGLDRATRVVWKVFRRPRRERAAALPPARPGAAVDRACCSSWCGRRVVYDVHEDAPKQIMNKFWIPWWAKRVLSTRHRGLMERVGRGRVRRRRGRDPVDRRPVPGAARRSWCRTSRIWPRRRTLGGRRRRADARRSPTPAVSPRCRGCARSSRPPALLPVGPRRRGGRRLVRRRRAGTRGAGGRGLEAHPLPRAGHPDRGARRDPSAPAAGWSIDHPISNYLDSYSTKMFEYMACGVPVVCSDFPLWAQLVGDADCGVERGSPGPAGGRQGRGSALPRPRRGAPPRRRTGAGPSSSATTGRTSSPSWTPSTGGWRDQATKRVLVLSPHTDDAELGCGGTMARWTDEGAEVFTAAFSTAEAVAARGVEAVPARGTSATSRSTSSACQGEPVHLRLPGPRARVPPPGGARGDGEARARGASRRWCSCPSGADLHQDHAVVHQECVRAFRFT